MGGNTNPTHLANAQAQAAAAQQNNTYISQCRLCSECWIYFKKFSAFKYPSAKYEKNIQNKNQVHKCSVSGCGKEFKMKQLLVKHCGIAHGYFAKSSNPPGQNDRPAIRNRTAFYLLTTPMTKAARLVATDVIKLRKLSKKPFKLVDLAELNRQWSKESRNIAELCEKAKKKKPIKKPLDVKLILKIAKNTKRLNDDDENSNDLVIEDTDKPEFLKYFEQKCTTPCYEPERIAFPKPTSEQINKFHFNLISQSRKRPHESTNGDVAATKIQNGSENDSNDSSPQSKRTLLAPKQQNPIAKQVVRAAQKSSKPTQSSNLPNSPQDIYFVSFTNLKNVRKELDGVWTRKIARKPYRLLGAQHANLYKSLENIRSETASKLKKDNGSVDLNLNETSNDTVQSNKIESKTIEQENEGGNLVVLD